MRKGTEIPVSALIELQSVGKAALEKARVVETHTLVIQGLEDDTVLPEHTRDLVKRLAGPVSLLEVPGDHQIVRENREAWTRS